MKGQNTSPDEIIASAKRLLDNGTLDEAQNLLLDEGYVKRLEPLIQKAYVQLIPVNPTLREVLDEIYQGLNDPSPKIRFNAVTKLLREFAKERLRGNVRWMRDPRASEPIIRAVSDPDSKVSQRALRTLSRLVCQYFPDQRALPAFLSRLTDRKQETRTDAISGIGCLRHEDLLKYLAPLMEQGTDQDRATVSGQLWGLSFETFFHMNQHPIQWSEAGRQFWRDKMITALRDSYVQVRKHAARALKGLGDSKMIPALQAARDVESDDDTAFYMDDTIAALKERN
jgi:HEAT repeat protein